MPLIRALSLALLLSTGSEGLRIRGVWDSRGFATVLAKFGFQQTDPLALEHTRGYIYGNITAKGSQDGKSRLLLVLASKTYFPKLYEAAQASRGFGSNAVCAKALNPISSVAFDHKCMSKGSQDFFRWVPCPHGSLCPDEDDVDSLVPGFQFTYRTQDKFAAGYWYLVLIACDLTSSCNWTLSSDHFNLEYDIWLVNGNPSHAYSNPFEHQFSFDEQDTTEIYMVAFALFLSLALLQHRGVRIVAKNPPKRLRALRAICLLKTLSITWNLLHVFAYSFNGKGLLMARWLGDLTNMLAGWLLTLLVVLLARGWSMRTRVIRSPRAVLFLWALLSLLHLVFFVWNSKAVDDIEEIDIFETYPGYGILIIRVVTTLWFLVELRNSISKDERVERANFLLHFGAGFLVWFLYLPLLGALASQIDLLWRFKAILCVSYLADFAAMGLLVHVLWPRSTHRRFFLDEEEVGRLAGATETLEEYVLLADDVPEDPVAPPVPKK